MKQKAKPNDEIREIVNGLLDCVITNGLTLDELAKYLREALKPFAKDNGLCIDCSVLHCWKVKGRYWANGSTINPTPFVCNRRKRCYTWAQVKEAQRKLAH